MTETTDRALRAWLEQGPDRGPSEGLARALAATRRTPQRPGWSFPERWLPMQLTFTRTMNPRPMLFVVLALLLAAAVAAAALWVGSQQRRVPPAYGLAANGAIAFQQSRAIALMDQDGTNIRVVSDPSLNAFGPAFSRDGTRLAYWGRTSPSQPLQLIVAGDTGTGPLDVISGLGARRLAANIAPAWSPDGSELAFVVRGDDGFELLIARADRVETRAVLTSEAKLDYPTWSPDGSRLAMRRTIQDGGNTAVELLAVPADGSSETVLFSNPVPRDQAILDRTLQYFEWSPDGERIAFHNSAGDILVVDMNRSVTPIAASPDAEVNPAWSPDGRWLAFFGSNLETLVVAASDGSSARTLGTRLLGGPCPLAWSPDGTQILGAPFTAECAATSVNQLAAVDVATGAVTRLAVGVSSSGLPSWQRLAVP